MSDLIISKSELIEALKQRMKLHEKDAETLATKEAFYDDEELYLRLADECQAIIELVEKQKTDDKWIPCSKQLPDNLEEVLVWFEYFRYGDYNCLFQTKGISYTFNGEWSGFVNGSSGWRDLKIIAWMPLPEDYKGE